MICTDLGSGLCTLWLHNIDRQQSPEMDWEAFKLWKQSSNFSIPGSNFCHSFISSLKMITPRSKKRCFSLSAGEYSLLCIDSCSWQTALTADTCQMLASVPASAEGHVPLITLGGHTTFTPSPQIMGLLLQVEVATYQYFEFIRKWQKPQLQSLIRTWMNTFFIQLKC